jgi:cytochrome c553
LTRRLGRPLLLATLAAVSACSRGYAPGLGELMSLQQMRHDKLWRAGQEQNWQLASYELDELGEGFDDIVKFHPTHKDSPVALSDVVPTIMGQPLRAARAAIDAKDGRAFAEAYEHLTAACNSCHQATNFGFNVVRRPADAGWFANQDFAPH